MWMLNLDKFFRQIPDAVCAVLSSWWWTENPSETCTASYRNKWIEKRRIWLAVLCECPINFLTHTSVSSYKTNEKTNYNKSSCPQRSHGNRKKKLNKRVTSTPHRPIEGAVRFSSSLKVVQETLSVSLAGHTSRLTQFLYFNVVPKYPKFDTLSSTGANLFGISPRFHWRNMNAGLLRKCLWVYSKPFQTNLLASV